MVSARNQQFSSPFQRGELADLVQDCLAAIWSKLSTYSGRAQLETWVYRFCFLQFMKKLRMEQRFPKLIDDSQVVGDELFATPPVANSERYEHIYLGLESLDEAQLELIHLKHFDGLSFRDIADAKGIAPSTIKTRYYEAIFKLRGRLAAMRSKETSRDSDKTPTGGRR